MTQGIGVKIQNVWITASLQRVGWQKKYARKLFLGVSGGPNIFAYTEEQIRQRKPCLLVFTRVIAHPLIFVNMIRTQR